MTEQHSPWAQPDTQVVLAPVGPAPTIQRTAEPPRAAPGYRSGRVAAPAPAPTAPPIRAPVSGPMPVTARSGRPSSRANAAAGHGALAPGVAAGRGREEDGGENDDITHYYFPYGLSRGELRGCCTSEI